MTLAALSDTLPNGFHDAHISDIKLDFSNGSVVLQMSLDVTTTHGEPRYRTATILATGVRNVVLGAIDLSEGPLAASGYPVTQHAALPESMKSPDIRELLYSFFLEDLNGTIYLAATHAELSWSEHDPGLPNIEGNR